MEQTKIVARFQDGRVLKGYTADLLPNRDVFHLVPGDAPHADSIAVHFSQLKAVFIVKDFAGHPEHKKKNEFQPGKPPIGRKIEIVFKDGEKLLGTTQAYNATRPNFYVIPADPESNIERCLVMTAATKQVKLL